MQLRAITGYAFEREVRGREGFERYIKAPRIRWSGVGRNNVERLVSLGKNPELFKPIIEESRFIRLFMILIKIKLVLYHTILQHLVVY